MNLITEGMVCNECAAANKLLWTDDYESQGALGVCDTCKSETPVISTRDYVIPANVHLVRQREIGLARMASELEVTTRMFHKQTELYDSACKEIEKLEDELRMLRLGSKWSGK